MTSTPRERFHSHVDILRTGMCCLQDGGHLEARARMTVVGNRNVGMFLLDLLDDPSDGGGTSHACHILDAYLIGTHSYQRVSQLCVVFHSVYR